MQPNGNPRYNKLGVVADDTKNPNGDYPDGKFVAVVVAAFILAIVGLVAFLEWLSYHPDFPDFSVSSFEVSGFNLSSDSLTSGFNVSVAIRNPNKMASIVFKNVKAAVLYSTGDADRTVLDSDDFVIAKTPMFPFSQGPKNVTALRARMSAAGLHVDDEGAIRSGDGGLRFGVRVSLTVGFRGAWIPESYYKVKVYCDGVLVGMKNSTAVAGVGSMVGPARGCRRFTY